MAEKNVTVPAGLVAEVCAFLLGVGVTNAPAAAYAKALSQNAKPTAHDQMAQDQ